MRDRGLANWSLSFGRQRQGLLELENQPAFLQNLKMNRLSSATQQIDIAALDLIRDREHGIPKFNEFRRQYGLRQLTSFDDFIDKTSPRAAEQTRIATTMREVYGQHRCDASKPITDAQRNAGWFDHQRLSRSSGRVDGRQYRRRRHRRRLPGRAPPGARVRDL